MKEKLRRSGAKIMASLIVLLGSLSYIMILAVINGSVGFIAAMGVTVAGATGIAKALGVRKFRSRGARSSALPSAAALSAAASDTSNNTATTISRSSCWRCCAIRYSARFAFCAQQNSKASRRAASSL